MHKIVTFLGLKSRLATYCHGGRTYEKQVFAEVLRELVDDFDRMLVFVTEQAYRETYPTLAALHDERIAPVHIPTGETTAEMWETFEAVTNAVDEGDEVTFDITHGLRSIPFLVFLAAAFLKSAKGVTIGAVYYGALELSRAAEGAPIIELTDFIGLLDWLNASNQFIRLGDATALADQLLAAQPHPTLRQQDEVARRYSKQLGDAAGALNNVSLALRLILPDQAMEASDKLRGVLTNAATATGELARPFAVLAERVADAYAPLGLPHPHARESRVSSLSSERRMVRWYLERSLLVQAVVLGREWLVTWGVVLAKLGDPYDNKRVRDEVEHAFAAASSGRGHYSDHVFSSGRRLYDLPSHAQAIGLFDKLGNVRNILCHANKRLDHVSAQRLEKNAIKWCQELDSLPISDAGRVSS